MEEIFLPEFHPHNLERKIYYNQYGCDGCRGSGFGLRSFKCEQCDFDLHDECAHVKQTTTHDFYKENIFKFFPQPTDHHSKIHCAVCGYSVQGFVFYCEELELCIHPCCHSLPKSMPRTDSISVEDYNQTHRKHPSLNQPIVSSIVSVPFSFSPSATMKLLIVKKPLNDSNSNKTLGFCFVAFGPFSCLQEKLRLASYLLLDSIIIELKFDDHIVYRVLQAILQVIFEYGKGRRIIFQLSNQMQPYLATCKEIADNVSEAVYMQHLMGIDGVIVDLVQEITESVSDIYDNDEAIKTGGRGETRRRWENGGESKTVEN
ncbi:hypothetical protein Q3G72_005365 [Acer saccharum]|nr:hypothetical protein Q3G72_005365 [Acer saccharum]